MLQSQKQKAKISVVIPTYNRPDRVKKAIGSVLSQTFQDFEIVVVDDGLEKRADDVVKSFKDERVRYIQHKVNKGGAVARNTGIKNAKADWIAFLDDDDEWHSDKLEKQYKIIEKHKENIGFVFCDIEEYNEKTKKTSVNEGRLSKYEGIVDLYEALLAHKIRTYTPTLVIKKNLLDKAGMFDEATSKTCLFVVHF